MGVSNESDVIDWHPTSLVQRSHTQAQEGQGGKRDEKPGFALVVLNQPLVETHLGLIQKLWNNAFFHIAADGGANVLYDAARDHGEDHCFDNLRVIIGDLDSIRDDVRAYYENTGSSSPANNSTQVIHFVDDYSTDFGKAVNYIRENHSSDPLGRCPVDIVAIGGLGGRVDQGLSQLHHLYLYQTDPLYADGRMYLFSGDNLTFLLKAGSHRIHVREPGQQDAFGKYVGILPIKEPSVISTKGLEWDVTDWLTQFGGQVSTSNHLLPETRVIEVATSKDVIFTISLRQI